MLLQTYSLFECIVVATEDEMQSLNNHKAIIDARVRVIKSGRIDQSSKRNIGIENAKGEYICFLDCDDYLDTNYFQIVKNILVSIKCDLISFDITRELSFFGKYSNNIRFINCMNDCRNIIYSLYMFYSTPSNIIMDTACSKMFKLKIIKDNSLRFVEGMACGEDAIFVRTYGIYVNDMILCEKSFPYYWRLNPNSTTSDINSSFWNLEPFCARMIDVSNYLPTIFFEGFPKYMCLLFISRIRFAISTLDNNGITIEQFINHIKNNYNNIKCLRKVIKIKIVKGKTFKAIWFFISNKLYFFLRIFMILRMIKHKTKFKHNNK